MKPDRIVRPCCGAWTTLALLLEGNVRLPHKRGCR